MNFGVEFELCLCDRNSMQYPNITEYRKQLKDHIEKNSTKHYPLDIYDNHRLGFDGVDLFDRAQSIGWSVKGDGSIRIGNIKKEFFKYSRDLYSVVPIEIVTPIYKDYLKFIKDMMYVFNTKLMSINEETDKDLMITFNTSTGMHIHYSNDKKFDTPSFVNTLDRRLFEVTVELKYLRNVAILEDMLNFIHSNCKYDKIKANLKRDYSENINIQRRYSAINVSNHKLHGTIEFRMFNLNGITNKNFYASVVHMIQLMIKSILLGYEKAIKISADEELKKIAIETYADFKSQKILRKNDKFDFINEAA